MKKSWLLLWLAFRDATMGHWNTFCSTSSNNCHLFILFCWLSGQSTQSWSWPWSLHGLPCLDKTIFLWSPPLLPVREPGTGISMAFSFLLHEPGIGIKVGVEALTCFLTIFLLTTFSSFLIRPREFNLSWLHFLFSSTMVWYKAQTSSSRTKGFKTPVHHHYWSVK